MPFFQSTRSRVLASLILLVFSRSGSGEDRISRQQSDAWLQRMGFADISGRRLPGQTSVGRSPESQTGLRLAQERFEVINYARDLATLIYDAVQDRLGNSPGTDQALARLTARMLTLKPAEIPDEWPPEAKTDEQRETYARKYFLKQIESASERLVADIASAAYGKEKITQTLKVSGSAEARAMEKNINSIRALVFPYVTLVNADPAHGQSHYLGDTMALLFTRHSRLHQGPDGSLEKMISAETSKRGGFLQNSISDQPIFRDAKGRQVRVPIKNGSLIFSYTGGKTAAETALSIPNSIEGIFRAVKYGLLANPASLLARWNDSHPPDPRTYRGRARLWAADSRLANRGLSHSGQAFVDRDPQTGLAHITITDRYSSSAGDEIRSTTLDGFAPEGLARRIAVASYNPQKLAKEFLRQAPTQSAWTLELTTEQRQELRRLAGSAPKTFQRELVHLAREATKKIEVTPAPTDVQQAVPINLFTQSAIDDRDRQVVELKLMNPRERQLAQTSPYEPPADKELQQLLRSVPSNISAPDISDYWGETWAKIQDLVRVTEIAANSLGPSRNLGGRTSQGNVLRPPISPAGETTSELRGRKKSSDDSVGAIDAFLRRLGLRDYSADMQKSLDERLPPNRLARKTTQANKERYEVVNIARELGALLVSRAAPKLDDPAFRARFLDLAADLLALKPTSPVRQIPASVRSSPDPIQRAREVGDYFEAAQRHKGELQLEKLVSDYLNVFYGKQALKRYRTAQIIKDIANPAERREAESTVQAIGADAARVTHLLAQYNWRMNLDPQVGSTRWLGRAVALGIARHAKQSGDDALMVEFGKAVRDHDLHLENFVGDQLVFQTSRGLKTVPVKTGDFILGRSATREAGVISSSSVPYHYDRATRQGLIGNPFSALLPQGEELVSKGLSRGKRLLYGLSQLEIGNFNKGKSHIGVFDVPVDPETGIRTHYVRDNYPDPEDGDLGGVRINGVEHYGSSAHYDSLSVASIDLDKLYDYGQRELARVLREGWDPVAWKAFKPKLDGEDNILPDAAAERGDWMKKISREEFIRFMSLDRESWKKEFQRRNMQGWDRLLREGTFFNWVDAGAGWVEIADKKGRKKKIYIPGKDYEGGAYCSSSCDLAVVRETGLDLEEPGRRGHYAYWLKALQRLMGKYIKPLRNLDLEIRVLGPSSLAAQRWVKRNLIDIQYPSRSIVNRIRVEVAPVPVEHDPEVTRILRTMPEYQQEIKRQHTAPINPVERKLAIDRGLYWLAAMGVATGARNAEEVLGFDPNQAQAKKQSQNNTVPISCKNEMEKLAGS